MPLVTPDYEKTWRYNGIDLQATISPCSWMYPDHRTQLRISFPSDTSNGGSLFLIHPRPFTSTTTEDLDDFIAAQNLTFVPCKKMHCNGIRILGSRITKKGTPEPLCERCFIDKLNADWKKAEARHQKREQKENQAMFAKGYTHKIDAWIHPSQGGDDYQITYYSRGEPTKNEIEAELRKKRSRVLTDYVVAKIPANT